jgi:uncharacterized repeat protein (TIGR03803 family)
MRRRTFAATLLIVAPASSASAQYTLNTLASFNGTDGRSPEGDLVLSGNTLYGTTYNGGSGLGEVFAEPLAGGSPTVLATFDGTDGQYPVGGLVLSGNTLYGTTYEGGANGPGEVFSLPVSGGTPTVLTSFSGGDDGAYPESPLILSGNTLYGTTYSGGPYADGNVFSVPITGGAPTILASFNGTNGEHPYSRLLLVGSTLYGTTYAGGAHSVGEVFSVPVTGGTPTVLASFDGSNGAYPYAGLIQSGNTLFGTTSAGGAYDHGEVYSIPLTGGTPTVLASFYATDGVDNGEDIVGGLVLSGSTLYGTAYLGGEATDPGTDGDGAVFSVPITGGVPSDLASFNGTNGDNPDAGLIMDASGNLYGTTYGGGANADGTVFELSVPEPTSASLLAAGSLFLLRRTRRPLRHVTDG